MNVRSGPINPIRFAVLELGCGRFRNPAIEQFKPMAPFVVKVDISRLDLLVQLHQGKDRVRCLQADAMALPFREHSFDVVMWRNLLDFIPVVRSLDFDAIALTSLIAHGREKFLADVFRILNPGGLALSDDLGDSDGLNSYSGPIGEDLRRYAEATDLARIALFAGFEIVSRNTDTGVSVFRRPLRD